MREPVRVLDLRTGETRWRLPPGIVTGDVLVHQDGRLLTWYDAARGTRTGDAILGQHGTFALVGTSQDGSRAVLARTQMLSTTFAIVSRSSQQVVRLRSDLWSFDALRGSKLFLIRQVPQGYQVRLYDLARSILAARPLKDPGEPATIAGVAFARTASPGGRYLFTLYLGSDGGAMIHVLDLVAGTARCVGLPGTGDFSSALTWALVPDPDGRSVWALGPGYAKVVAVDAPTHRVRRVWSFAPGRWTANPGQAVLSPDGSHFALSDAQHVWFLTLEPAISVRRVAHVAVALGWSPDQRRLWVVGERSRVSPLAPVR